MEAEAFCFALLVLVSVIVILALWLTKRHRKEFSAILFDMDGTLVETKLLWYNVLSAAAERFGCPPIDYEIYKQNFGQAQGNCANYFRGANLKEVHDYIEESYHEHLNSVTLIPNAKELIQEASKYCNGKIAICTNCPQTKCYIILKQSGLYDYFHEKNIICADMAVQIKNSQGVPELYNLKPKPSPDTILRACSGLGVNPEDTLYLGDAKFDIDAARKAGCRVVAGLNVEGGDLYLSDLQQLRNILNGSESVQSLSQT